jgi:hypothetical protein
LPRLALAGLVVVAVTTSCVHPAGTARNLADYESKAKNTAESVLSAVETAGIAVDAGTRDRAFPAFVTVVVGEAESDATAAVSGFEAIQPPNATSDRLRDQLGELTDQATDILADTRIAARRAETSDLLAQTQPLQQTAEGLRSFIAEHS